MARAAAAEDTMGDTGEPRTAQALEQPQEPEQPTEPAQEAAPSQEAEPRASAWGKVKTDLMVIVGYAAMAVLVTARFWQSPTGRTSGINPADQSLFEWFLANAAYTVTHLENPFFSTRLDVPEGINLMANTSVLGMAIPLTPVTLLWGPAVAYVVMITLIFLATATAWYFVLSRYVVTARLAAFAGGGFCAFAPGMLSQANAHPHILAQFLVPVIAWRGFRLRETTRPVRDGAILGLLAAYQVFIGEEVLFLTALACVVVMAWYLVERRREALRQWRPFLTGVAAAAVVGGVLLAYPLYSQFFGPRNYSGVPWFADFKADLGAYPAFSRMTLAGDPYLKKTPLAQNLTELTSFFGWPLLVVVGAIVVWLRKKLAVRITAGVIVIFAAFSLGREVHYGGRPTGVPGPWRYLAKLPVFDVVVPTRFALVVASAIGVLLALAIDHAMRQRGMAVKGVPVARLVVLGVIVLALLPLAPRPLPAAPVAPVPAFFTSGAWRQYVTGDGSVMPAVPTRPNQLTLMRWAASQHNDFRVTHGYFLAPDPASPENYGTLGRPTTPTMQLLLGAAASGRPQQVGEAQRAAARAELAWREVAILVMSPQQVNGDAVRATLDPLVGPGRLVDDLWVWDVRGRG